MRRRTPGGLTASAAVVVCLALGACTAEPATDDPETTATGSPTSDPAASTTSASPSTTVEESTTSQSRSTPSTTTPSTTTPGATSQTPTATTPTPPASSAAGRARAAQIKAAELPGFNVQWVWDRHRTFRGPGRKLPPVCSVTSLISIGGSVAYRTDYGSSLSTDAAAIQVTAVFPDEQTASTAEQILVAWHDRCQQRVDRQGLEDAEVSAISEIPTDVGPGRRWMTTYRPVPGEPDSTWFNAEGFVRSADMITYLVIRSAGQDYNYPRGKEPIDKALEVAARYLRTQR